MQPWPKFDKKKIVARTFTLVVQVNGKTRAALDVAAGISQGEAEKLALSDKRVINALNDKNPARIIYVPGKLVNFVL